MIEVAESAPSDGTIIQYQNAMRRMEESNQSPEDIGKDNRKSYNCYRAALVFCTKRDIRNAYAKIVDDGALIPLDEAEHRINHIERCLAILERYPPHGGGAACLWSAPPEGQSRKGKRRGLSRLPLNWREMIVAACPATSEYAAPLLLSALVGLRPRELCKGVIVGVTHGHLAIRIEGAKVTSKTGQPKRGMALPVDNVIAHMLADMVAKRGEGGKLRVSIHATKKSNSAAEEAIIASREYCDFVRSLSRRVFPGPNYIVTPYSFRHAFGSDQKALKIGTMNLAKALGHVSGRSQRAYGSAGQGRHPLVRLTEVTAPLAVRALDRAMDYAAFHSKQGSAPGMQPGCPALDLTNGYKVQRTTEQDATPDMAPGC
jgi:integrase